MQLVLQPCGDKFALAHYERTVSSLVPLAELLPFLSGSQRKLVETALPSKVAVWGATAGGNNATKWQRVETGDVALFYRSSRFFQRGEVAFKARNAELARHLWGEKSPGVTWECLYFLTGLKPIDISIVNFNRAAERSIANLSHPVLGFDVLNRTRSAVVAEALGIEDSTTALVADQNELAEAEARLKSLPDALDRSGTTSVRVEQRLLRKLLLSNKAVEACAICGEAFPIDLLVIGHILKRATCTPQERKNMANVMPVCLLGCDSLFEKGYITVADSGALHRGREATGMAPLLKASIEKLLSRKCLAWNELSAPYFARHFGQVRGAVSP